MINENDPETLSASGQLSTYNTALKTGLQHGITYTKLLDQLRDTKDPRELLTAATELSTYQLDSEYVTFPHQYSVADYYLLFMTRLMDIHEQASDILVESAVANRHLSHRLVPLTDQGVFAFELANETDGGAYYAETLSGQRVFYLNLKRQMMSINSAAIVNLFIVAYASTLENNVKLKATQFLMDFGYALKTDFGFSVDFNILDPANNEFYEFQNANAASGVLDKLFIAAADDNRRLLHNENGVGAVLPLADNLELKLTNHPSTTGDHWGIYVHDKDQQTSWFMVLLQFDFLRCWYLDNLSDLQIRSDSLLF